MRGFLIFIALMLPFIFMSLNLYMENVTDPIKYIYTFSGYTAITLLFITTTLSIIKKQINLIKHRRLIGLTSFFYAFIHLINFIIFDMELDFMFAFTETLDKPFIYLGMISFLLLLFMALTSTRALFKKFVKYHKVIYIALALTTIHFIMAQKALSEIQWFFLGVIGVISVLKMRQLIKTSKT